MAGPAAPCRDPDLPGHHVDRDTDLDVSLVARNAVDIDDDQAIAGIGAIAPLSVAKSIDTTLAMKPDQAVPFNMSLTS